MSLSVTPQASPLGGRLVEQTATTNTANNNVTGGAGTLFLVDIDNTGNVAPTWLKIWDDPAPTVGTTAADWVMKVPAGVRRTLGIIEGIAFTALSFAALGGGPQADVSAPAAPVPVRLLTS